MGSDSQPFIAPIAMSPARTVARIQVIVQTESKALAQRSKKRSSPIEDQLSSYSAPWKGQLLLACAKCQKKLRRDDSVHPLGKLRKAIKRYVKKDKDRFRLRVIETPCLKLCPKGGVTVCTQAQLGQAQCSILRTAEQAQQLYVACKQLLTNS